MCLAVPGKVVKRDGDLKATVDMMGIERPVSLRLVPTAQVGDYILVHASSVMVLTSRKPKRHSSSSIP